MEKVEYMTETKKICEQAWAENGLFTSLPAIALKII
jgi:hypothetical protein